MIKKYPFYVRVTVTLLGLVIFVYCLFVLREIFVPLAFALLLAVLLNPLVNLLQKRRFPKVLAIATVLLAAMIAVTAIVYLLYLQIGSFSDQLPEFGRKLNDLGNMLQQKAKTGFGISLQKQAQYISEAEAGLKPVVASFMGSAAGVLTMVLLLPVYAFLFLFYKPLLTTFFYEIFSEENASEVGVILSQTKGAVQSYMVGLLLEALIVAILNTIALFALGVEYAILLGILGALLNILPFVGGILSVFLPILMATLTKDGLHTQVWIVFAYLLIQFIDNHFLVPYIVSSKVKVNALISIVIVLMGGMLWGISGMFLSILFTGVLKIIFDRIPEMKPWGRLLGTEVPIRPRGQFGRLAKKLNPGKLRTKKNTI
jgi:predicted PurR-regulated permease PerM